MKKKIYISLLLFVGAFSTLTFFGFYDYSVVSNFSKPPTADLFDEPDNYNDDSINQECTYTSPVILKKEIEGAQKKVENIKQLNFQVSKSEIENYVENSMKQIPSNASINLFIEQYKIVNNENDSVQKPFLFTYDSYTAILKKVKDTKEPSIKIEFKDDFKGPLDSHIEKVQKENLQCRNLSKKNNGQVLAN